MGNPQGKGNEVSSSEETLSVAKQLFSKMGAGATPEDIASLFSEDVDWDIPGNVEIVPWIGKKIGRTGVADFNHQIRTLVESVRFEVSNFLVGGNRAVVLGALESRVISTGKLITTEFAYDLTIENGQIIRFRMFEDSFAVSEALI
jgi:ketosteroid isomerase-like protein